MKTRKDFLLASSLLMTSTLTFACERNAAASAFDIGRFNQLTSRNAAHRHCFGIHAIAGGEGLYAMDKTLGTYQQDLGTPLNKVFVAGVLYGGPPITMAFNDDIWNNIVIPTIPHVGPSLRADFASVQIGAGNPFLYRPSNSNGNDASVESLVKRGTHFFVCNNSARELSSIAANALGRQPQEVYQQFVAGLVPGASLVPTGVWAINALQEKNFTYLAAS